VEISADLLAVDLPLTVLVALLCMTVFRRNHMVSRREGLVFVVTYLAYLASLIWTRT
jgi:Ca2+/Na+ antiporter